MNPIHRILRGPLCFSVFTLLVAVLAGAQTVVRTIPVGAYPFDIALNPVTNKIYVSNTGDSTVTVIDGATNATTTISTGTTVKEQFHGGIAVNPLTNKIYVSNSSEGTVVVIDGATNATTTLTAGYMPGRIAINKATNKIYVANIGDGTVTVIDGATNATTTVISGTVTSLNFPYFYGGIAVNEVTNKIYDANFWGQTFTIIDGATNNTTQFNTGGWPFGVAVDSSRNKIYITTQWGYPQWTQQVDGDTLQSAFIQTGWGNGPVAVNKTTNKVYVANWYTSDISVIDAATLVPGNTYSAPTVPAGFWPWAFAIDESSNQIYVINYDANDKVTTDTMTSIDGATNHTATVRVGRRPAGIALNVSTHKLYVANYLGNSVTVIDEGVPGLISSPVPGSTLTGPTETFQWTAGTDASQYKLKVGTYPGGSDITAVDAGAALSAVVGDLPIDGSSIYVRLYSLIAGTWVPRDYTYTAITATPAVLTNPLPGSTFTGTSATFQWTAGANIAQYHVAIGSTLNGNDIADIDAGTSTSTTVNNLPVNGMRVFVKLSSRIGDGWVGHSYIYNASGTSPAAELTSPAEGSTLGTSATFNWTTGTGASNYMLFVGMAPGWHDVAEVGPGTATSATLSGLPADGRKLVVTLYSQIGTIWQPRSYTFYASGTPTAATITSPAPGSKLSSSTAVFAWTAVPGVGEYHLHVGTAPGKSDIAFVNAGRATLYSVSGLPTNGAYFYVTLYTSIGKSLLDTVSSYIASGTGTPAEITSPTPGTVLPGTDATFVWSAGSGTSRYRLHVGTTWGGKEISIYAGHATSYEVSTLPTTGVPVYVTIYSLIGDTWYHHVYTYTAATAP